MFDSERLRLISISDPILSGKNQAAVEDGTILVNCNLSSGYVPETKNHVL